MKRKLHVIVLLLLLCIMLLLPLVALCLGEEEEEEDEEQQVLLAFKASADVSGNLGSWEKGANPCGGNWTGVVCLNGRVSRLVLEDLHLVGPMDALVGLRYLRVLSLKNNALDGSLPDFSRWINLKLLFLGRNRFSGRIPDSLSLLGHLWRLDLSNNELTGSIPASIDSLSHLLTLRLEGNSLSGNLPSLSNLTKLADFNVSGNHLSGSIPETLAAFNASAFVGNPQLCGLPLATRCAAPGDLAAPPPAPATPTATNASPPAATLQNAAVPPSNKKSKLSTGAIVAIVVGDTIVLFVMAFMFAVYYWNKYARGQKQGNKLGIGSSSSKLLSEAGGGDKPGYAASQQHFYCNALQVPDPSAAGGERGNNNNNKLVFFDPIRRNFDLEDLLRASAEMLGKGSLGSAYKAVLDDGSVVAVKRLKDVTSSNRKDFEQHMELIGRLRYPHLVQLRAYFYAKDEKLLVYDYMPNGSLHSLLHGNRGPGRVPLDWTTRVKIALGAARGLAYIHQESGSHKIPHGNIKSSNVLLDKNGGACVGDFGLALLMNSAACSRLMGYRAPEHSETKRISQKGDVYSFGVLLLEILTGKAPLQSAMQEDGVDLPRWVQSVVREEWTSEVFDLELMRYKNIEEEMVAMLQIAMSCVSQAADARPKMSHVARMIEEIRADNSPARDDSFDSHSLSSSLSDAGTTSQ